MDKIKKALHTLELANLVGEDIQKARVTKYYRREGGPGNYKYYYTKAEYDKAKGGKKEETTSKKKVGTEKITWIEEWVDEDTGGVIAEKRSGKYVGDVGLDNMKNEYDETYSKYKKLRSKVNSELEKWDEDRYDLRNIVELYKNDVDYFDTRIKQINAEMEANAPEVDSDEFAEKWTSQVADLEMERQEAESDLIIAQKKLEEHEDKYPEASEEEADLIESLEEKARWLRENISNQEKLRKVARVKDILTDLVNDPPEGFYEDVADTFGEPDDDGESESELIERIMSGHPISMVEDWVYEQNSKSTKEEENKNNEGLRKSEYLNALQELGLDIEKGRTREGVYANTSENRKLGRVGQKYKKEGSGEDKKEGKKESSSPKERDLTGMVVNDVIDDIEKDISKFWRINAVDTSPLGGTFKRIHFSSLEWSNPIREYIKGKYGVDPKLEHNVRAGSVTLMIPKKSIVNMRKYLTDKEFRQSVSEQARHGTLVGGKGRPVRL